MKTRLAVALSAAFIALSPLTASATGIAVFDSANLAEAAKSIIEMKRTVDTLQNTYSSMNGNRGLGSALYDPSLRNYLPREWRTVYDSAAHGGLEGISGSIGDILAQETRNGSVDDMQREIRDRERYSAATNKAIGMEGYRGMQSRLNQLESLLPQIDAAQDPKAMQEIQARIAVEQAAINNEMTKLQLIAMLQNAEERHIELSKDQLARKILSSDNTGMARLKWQ